MVVFSGGSSRARLWRDVARDAAIGVRTGEAMLVLKVLPRFGEFVRLLVLTESGVGTVYLYVDEIKKVND